jgi:hypothetical protein
MKFLAGIIALTALLAVPAVQAQDGYLDYYIVKVKPEKRTDFEAVAKKIAAANRKSGDRWLAFQTEYGEGYTVSFSSARKDMAAIDTGSKMFMDALKENYGEGMTKLFQEMDACVTGSRGEIRKRRMDLSYNPPKDEAEYYKMLGQTRWVRTQAVRIHSGHNDEFEELVHMVKAAWEKTDPEATVMVSQSAVGQPVTTYYFSSLRGSVGDFEMKHTFKELLGDEYARFQKGVADIVTGAETNIYRVLPALSNPPEEVVNISRDFWMPPEQATTVAARSKRKEKNK